MIRSREIYPIFTTFMKFHEKYSDDFGKVYCLIPASSAQVAQAFSNLNLILTENKTFKMKTS